MARDIHELADLLVAKLGTFSMGKWQDLSLDKQDYPMARRFIDRQGIEYGEWSHTYTWPIQKSNLDSVGEHVPYQEVTYSQDDILTQGSVNFVTLRSTIAMDTTEEQVLNARTGQQLVDLVDARHHSARNRLFEYLEEQATTAPASSSVNKLLGLKAWIVSNATAGFNGGNPTGFSSGIANVDSTTITQWKNYTGTWTAFTDSDFFTSLLTATYKCRFKPIDTYKELVAEAKPSKYEFHTGVENCVDLRLNMRNRNDEVGYEMLPMEATVFSQILKHQPQYDAAVDSTRPFYGINWGSFSWKVDSKLNGSYTGKPLVSRDYPTVLTWVMLLRMQMICLDRRQNFVFYKV